MAKDKKAKADKKSRKADAPKAAVKIKVKRSEGPKSAKARKDPLETLAKLADHPLISELIAVGALAAVAAVAEAGARDPDKVKSADAAKKAGKAAAGAIGARLLKEFSGSAKAAQPAKK